MRNIEKACNIVYAKHTEMTKAELKEIQKRDMWWNAKKSLASGLVDRIDD